jgi:N-acyl homoserine lactone hydrolase
MSIEPTALALPLPGGQPGAAVRLHPLLGGEILCPPGLLDRPRGRFARLRTLRSKRDTWTYIPVPAFLVEHPGAGLVLVDTALHHSVAVDPKENFGSTFARLYTFRMEPEQAIPAQLRARGLSAADVGTVVMTHLHTDHASGIAEFPEATFVVDAAEWAAATTGPATPNGYVRRQFDYPFEWRAVDYEAPAVDSFATFGRTVDLFGDGSVRLLSTPGHTAGHQSVLLRLEGREALLTGDAAYVRASLDGTAEPLLAHDRHRYERSLREIRRYLEMTPSALVITGHDAELWRGLAETY